MCHVGRPYGSACVDRFFLSQLNTIVQVIRDDLEELSMRGDLLRIGGSATGNLIATTTARTSSTRQTTHTTVPLYQTQSNHGALTSSRPQIQNPTHAQAHGIIRLAQPHQPSTTSTSSRAPGHQQQVLSQRQTTLNHVNPPHNHGRVWAPPLPQVCVTPSFVQFLN